MLAIINNAAINIGFYVPFQISVFVFFRYIPRIGSCIFFFLRNLHNVFHSGCTSLHSYQEEFPFLFSTYLPKFYCSKISFFLIAFLIGVRRYLIVVLVCISLMISNVEHLFIRLLAIVLLKVLSFVSGSEDSLTKVTTHYTQIKNLNI